MPNSGNTRRSFIKNSALAAAATVICQSYVQPISAHPVFVNDTILLPPRLKKGDMIALTAPAGAIFNADSIEKATKSFEGQGFRVMHGNTLTQKFGYLAGTDQYRANELTELFENKEVQGIIAMRGGWGCARLLPYMEFNKIKNNPKIFSGFSDISSLLLAIYSKTGLVTFHGPVGNSTLDGFTMENFLRIVKDGEALQMQQPTNDQLNVISAGKASGKLFGGNLSVWCSMIGTGYLPDVSGSILFFEETEEEPYRMDRMLTQLEITGTFSKAKGIIFGKCTKCEAEEPEKSFTLDEVYKQKFKNSSVPVVTGFNFGHTKDKFTFPIGVDATLDTATQSLTLNYACVV